MASISQDLATVTPTEVEQFLYAEAALLDEWRLDEWLALFVPDGRYEVPSPDDPGGDHRSSQFFIADDMDLIRARVKRLQSRQAHAENPRSRTHRLISNTRITASVGAALDVRASFILHRFRDGQVSAYVGWYEHRLAVGPEGLRFRVRRAVLGYERLPAATRLSFIV